MHDRYLKYDVDFKVDIWMLGCILYVLCFTKHPFQDAQTLAILNGSFEFPQDQGHISEESKSLIKVMLRVNPAERPTIDQVIKIIQNLQTKITISKKDDIKLSLEHSNRFAGKQPALQQETVQKRSTEEQDWDSWGFDASSQNQDGPLD